MKLVTKGLIGYGAFCLVTAGVVASIPAIERGQCTAGDQAACDRVEARDKRIADREAALVKAKEQEAKRKAALEKMEAEEAQRKAAAKAEKEAAEAKLKAEGWWEQQPGIFVRWCGDGSKHAACPGPSSNGYSNYTWRAMVWCKQRACGDIYARLNILNGGTVVGWTNDSAYGGYGQKVVLTFGSSTSGSGEIVEFRARG